MNVELFALVSPGDLPARYNQLIPQLLPVSPAAHHFDKIRLVKFIMKVKSEVRLHDMIYTTQR